MKLAQWVLGLALGSLLLSPTPALAQGHGNGHGNGKGHEKHGHGDDDDQGDGYYYRDRDREIIRGWYDSHESNLPPGLAKRDRLPPGLEKQLVRRGTLPPGLQKRLQPCPEELVRRLPPPPPECAHVLVAEHILILNRRTNLIVDVLHFE